MYSACYVCVESMVQEIGFMLKFELRYFVDKGMKSVGDITGYFKALNVQ